MSAGCTVAGMGVLATLCGCSALVPNSITPEIEHLSHASQHFGDHPTRYGADIASVFANWNVTPRLRVSIGEGVTLERYDPATSSYGEIVGPREEFSGRVSYTFGVRP